jgi:DNA (cytosine-5)-methyltransferase 1
VAVRRPRAPLVTAPVPPGPLPAAGRGHRVVEVCAGAGGQALGLEKAGFEHELAVEVSPDATATLRLNRPSWKVAEGDATSPGTWDPARYSGIDLLAGGVPCPPFTVAGKQLGAADDRDLLAWAVELCGVIRPRALMLENVRGLTLPRFSAYRQHVLDRLASFGYAADWRLLNASGFGVPQLRPRFVLVAMLPEDFRYFTWPVPGPAGTGVGEALSATMSERGWPGAAAWARRAAGKVAPTIVGGSARHGGPDLGPTRARRAWHALGVDGRGIADAPPGPRDPADLLVRLTCDAVRIVQGFPDSWEFTGLKTARYRQIGNAFPPPVAQAVGAMIGCALARQGEPRALAGETAPSEDPVYAVLRDAGGFVTIPQIIRRAGPPLDVPAAERHLTCLRRDFRIDEVTRRSETAYRLGPLRKSARP